MMPFFTTGWLPDGAVYGSFVLAWAAHFLAAYAYGALGRLSAGRRKTGSKAEAGSVPPVSVIIPAHDATESLRRNLPAILEQDYAGFEVIVVVDDTTSDATGDLLKTLELRYPHLRHTILPPGSRHVSRSRLALSVGIKSATHDWLLLTEAAYRPDSPLWLATMARHFHPGTQMVLGYANRMRDGGRASRGIIFHDLFQQVHYLPWAAAHRAYRCNPAHVAYRKSLFMGHNGFAGDVRLNGGAVEVLVNRHSRKDNTEVALEAEARLTRTDDEPVRTWRMEGEAYLETRRHFVHTSGYRLAYGLRQASVCLFGLATLAAVAWALWRGHWICAAAVVLLFVLLSVCKTVWFNRSARAVGEKPYHVPVLLWRESGTLLRDFRTWVGYHARPRSRFYRKAF